MASGQQARIKNECKRNVYFSRRAASVRRQHARKLDIELGNTEIVKAIASRVEAVKAEPATQLKAPIRKLPKMSEIATHS